MPDQVIVFTSDNYYHLLPGFAYLFNKYWHWMLNGSRRQEVVVCGFSPLNVLLPDNFRFYSIGRFEDYPKERWSDALLRVLDEVAEDEFLLLLEDYWLCRPVDVQAVRMLFDYARQFKNVLKIDLAADRLYIHGGAYFLYRQNNYGYCGYLDLLKSPPRTPYNFSLWGGIWRRDVMRRFVVPGETAQQLEIAGSNRVEAALNEVLVLGTRQQPLIHGNIIQSGKSEPQYSGPGWEISASDLERLREMGYI